MRFKPEQQDERREGMHKSTELWQSRSNESLNLPASACTHFCPCYVLVFKDAASCIWINTIGGFYKKESNIYFGNILNIFYVSIKKLFLLLKFTLALLIYVGQKQQKSGRRIFWLKRERESKEMCVLQSLKQVVHWSLVHYWNIMVK